MSLHSFTHHNKSTEAFGACVALCIFACFYGTLQFE